ncbi:hypothetical protein CN487_09220 [Bacillus cereus]|nr:hypothetical protein CN487_09220 [Bacillus cereus]
MFFQFVKGKKCPLNMNCGIEKTKIYIRNVSFLVRVLDNEILDLLNANYADGILFFLLIKGVFVVLQISSL